MPSANFSIIARKTVTLDDQSTFESIAISLKSRKVWLSPNNLSLTLRKDSKTVTLELPLRDNYDLVKRSTDKGAYLKLMPKLDMDLSEF